MFGTLKEKLKSMSSSVTSSFGLHHEDQSPGPKGELIMELTDGETGETLETRRHTNLITRDFSILLARLSKDNIEPNNGILGLAVGSGKSGWDLQNPPSPTDTQRSLYDELDRKGFADTIFRDDNGNSSSIPTNIVDFKTTFDESEAVGPIVEMGLLGGDVDPDMTTTDPITPANGPYDDTVDVTGKDMLCNYLTFPVINKPATAKLTITWRLTF